MLHEPFIPQLILVWVARRNSIVAMKPAFNFLVFACGYFAISLAFNLIATMKRKNDNNNKGRRTRNFTVAIENVFNVLPSCRDSEGEKDISKKSTEQLQEKREPTGHKYLTYSEKWLTVNETTFPSNRGSVSSLSVISIHSCFSGLDSLKKMRTRATDISMSFL